MPDLELAAVIRQVCDGSTETDPVAVAKLVLDRIPPANYETALAAALPHLVRAEFARYHGTWTVPATAETAAEPRQARESGKVARIRERWLNDRIAVLDGYKWLGDCTVDDLEHAAAAREKHAHETLARAGQLRALAALLVEHGVATVRELPADAIVTAGAA